MIRCFDDKKKCAIINWQTILGYFKRYNRRLQSWKPERSSPLLNLKYIFFKYPESRKMNFAEVNLRSGIKGLNTPFYKQAMCKKRLIFNKVTGDTSYVKKTEKLK